VFSSRWNRTNCRYRPRLTDRSINRWISVDICICVVTISHNLWDHSLLGGWLSGTIIHHSWDHRSLGLVFFSRKFVSPYPPSTDFFSTVDIDRRPIFFVWIDLDGRYRPIFVYYQSNQPSISTVILLKCNRTDRRYRPCSPVGAIEPTVDIDRDWPTGRFKSTHRTDDTCGKLTKGRVCLSIDLVCCGNIWKETNNLLDPDKLRVVSIRRSI